MTSIPDFVLSVADFFERFHDDRLGYLFFPNGQPTASQAGMKVVCERDLSISLNDLYQYTAGCGQGAVHSVEEKDIAAIITHGSVITGPEAGQRVGCATIANILVVSKEDVPDLGELCYSERYDENHPKRPLLTGGINLGVMGYETLSRKVEDPDSLDFAHELLCDGALLFCDPGFRESLDQLREKIPRSPLSDSGKNLTRVAWYEDENVGLNGRVLNWKKLCSWGGEGRV